MRALMCMNAKKIKNKLPRSKANEVLTKTFFISKQRFNELNQPRLK